jgi:predicted nucleic-acid-binding protein
MKMIADTNVLLRFVLDDDPEQYQLALDAIEQAEAVVVTNHALCEMAWVLRSPVAREGERCAGQRCD